MTAGIMSTLIQIMNNTSNKSDIHIKVKRENNKSTQMER
jgi:hypothetical protein